MAELHTGGHVPPNSLAYVRRPFDDQIQSDLLNGRWVLLLGPRQHGKTSAVVRLIETLVRAGIPAARFTTQSLAPDASIEALYQKIARTFARQFGRELVEPVGADRSELEEWLSAALPEGESPCVVVIDEASGIADDNVRGTFYRQLRAIHDARDRPWAPNLGAHLALLFAGTFSPARLVEDSLTSPFNVCIEHRTTDLSDGDLVQMLADLALEELAEYVPHIHELVRGQPFLSQFLLEAAAGGDASDPADDRLRRAMDDLQMGAAAHVQQLLTAVVSDLKVLPVAVSLVQAIDGIPYVATPEHDYLTIVGLARLDADGYLRLRNDLYAHVARQHPLLAADATEADLSTVPAPPNPSAFEFICDPSLRQTAVDMSDGGFVAMRAKRHRLALIAMGSAAEAMLIDFLESIDATELDKAKSAAGPNFSRHEDATRPTTWRLVNLIKVAHKHPRLASVNLPATDALREWRNLVHPALARDQGLVDDSLQPEATAATGLVGILIRELSR